MKAWNDLSPHKHHKQKRVPLVLHCLVEKVIVTLCNLLDPNRENRLITVFQHLILGFNTAFRPCCIAWYILDELRGVTFAKIIRERAAVDIALAIDDFWSGYLPCPKCATSWLNGDYLEGKAVK